MVSAGEAARRLGVSPITIQRWVDAGVVSAVRTHGGHRRIPLSEIRRALAARRPAQLIGPLAAWVEVLIAADVASIRTTMLAARRRSGSWSVVAEEIASAIAEIGRMWESGSCRIFEEQAASEALRRAAARCVADIPRRPSTRTAALFAVASERHTLGLSLAELVVAEAGWKSHWLGEGPPIEELDLLIEMKRPDLLVVSASQACPPRMVSSYQSVLEQAARREHVGLVLGGDGAWMPSEVALRIYSFQELGAALARGSDAEDQVSPRADLGQKPASR